MTKDCEPKVEPVGEPFVERVLRARARKAGDWHVVYVRVFRPFWVVEGTEAACLARVEGVFEQSRTIYGVDPLDALKNAVSYLYALFGPEHEGYELQWPNGEAFGE